MKRENQLKQTVKSFLEREKRDRKLQKISFDEALTAFLQGCQLRNLRKDTLHYYEREIGSFKRLLDEQGVPIELTHLTLEHIETHVILYMMEQGAQSSTINTRLRAIRAFFNWLDKKNFLSANPVKGLRLLHSPRQAVKTFSKEEVKALLQTFDLATFTGVRDYTFTLLLLETGVRLRELVHIDSSDVLFSQGQILIRQPKNGLERYVPIGKRMMAQLKLYLNIRGKMETDALFVTVNNERLSRKQVQNSLTKAGERANISGVRCSPHTFRHTFAKMSLLNGAGVFELQAILGHQSMDMVRVYVNLFSTEVKELHKKFSPVERL